MHKILTLFKREYRAAVRTKGFIISLVMVPLMMAGGFVAVIIMEKNVDTEDKHFVVLDHSGLLRDSLESAAAYRNQNDIFHGPTGEKVAPAYVIEFVEPDLNNPLDQQQALSERVSSKELHAFIEIGPGILHPTETEPAYLKYYTEHSFNDNLRYWFQDEVNNTLRSIRAGELNLTAEQTQDMMRWVEVEGMGLVTIDKKTGEQKEAEQTNELQTFLLPYVMPMLMFMLVMMSSMPLLSTVMEEKNEKIAEVLLGTVTPFEFMMGKVLGGIGVALTTAGIYVLAGIFSLTYMGFESFIPYHVLPWFFVYTILLITMVGSGMAALGATCNDNKDVQSLSFPAILPLIIPMFIIAPLIQNPTSPLATTMSLIPPFTPQMMVIRMATPVTIPLWQPIVGLVGVALFTLFSVWVGARIFRTAILITGQKPTFATLIKYAFKK
ncbi:MAG: ABC transporter permease [Bacteroidales bacterium]